MSRPAFTTRLRKLRLNLCLCLSVTAGIALGLPAARSENSPAPKAAPTNRPSDWKDLFDGKTLAGWTPSKFATQREVSVEKSFQGGGGAIVMELGEELSGITWANAADLPVVNYEIALEAMKLDGDDFFCGLTFPVGKSSCSFIAGGWGGTIVGLSSVDGMDASENETSTSRAFDRNRWYRLRVRVTPEKIEAWIDDEQVVDLATKDRKITIRYGAIENSLPLGIAAYQTRTAVRGIRLRRL
ncbi:MAG: DUF1080 domain-containing protein [Opitutus sp.]|nr:DUF1080 domain-containing protein [Opitutus sp.]